MDVIIPTTIKVGGFDYSVEVGDYHDKELEAKSTWGDHSEMLRRIRVASNSPTQQFSQSVLHEILHAVDAVYNRSELDEKVVSALSNGLYQVFEQLGIRFARRG